MLRRILIDSSHMEKVKNLDGLLLQVTAPSNKYDCISRSFAPKYQIEEEHYIAILAEIELLLRV